MGIVILANKKAVKLSPQEMMENLEKNIVNFKNRKHIENNFTLNNKIKKLESYPPSSSNYRKIKNLRERQSITNNTNHTLEFSKCSIQPENIAYISYIERIEKHISPILSKSLGKSFKSKDGRTHKITIPWLSWALSRGHLGVPDHF